MNILLVYTTKHGATKKCLDLLRPQLSGDVTMVNAKTDAIPNVSSFDVVILGGSIYAGKTQKEVRQFAETRLNALLQKKVFLFFASWVENSEYFKKNLPPELCQHATMKTHFGTEIDPGAMNLFEKLIVKVVGTTQPSPAIRKDRIAEFAQAVNAAA